MVLVQALIEHGTWGKCLSLSGEQFLHLGSSVELYSNTRLMGK